MSESLRSVLAGTSALSLMPSAAVLLTVLLAVLPTVSRWRWAAGRGSGGNP